MGDDDDRLVRANALEDEAWSDYGGEVQAYNATAWAEEAAAREASRQHAKARAEAQEEQSGTSKLLD